MLARTEVLSALLPGLLILALLVGCDTQQRDTPGPDPEVFPTDQTPAWSPGGDRIAYHHDARPTDDTTDVSGLYMLNLETDSTWLVVEGSARSPDWRPDGERIAFTTGNVYTVRPDGSDLQQVTAFGDSFFPAWSPDAQTISFGRSGSRKEVGIWFAHLVSSTFSKFGFGSTPADWSPNGKRIVYNFRDQLWTADTSRTDSTQLTDNDFTNNQDPAWSPDGQWIAWTAVTDDGSELWIMRADGSDEQRLAGPIAGEPSWDPDSKRLVFVKPDPETDHIALWTVRRDGSDLRQITTPSRNPLN